MYTFGINDEEFIRGKVPMTKAEVRAMIMVKARIAPEETGLISVQELDRLPLKQLFVQIRGLYMP